MKKGVLIALDLEGVNNVVGEAYKGLYRGTEEWEKARRQAALEINAAAEELFSLGVERVALWDNHGCGNNIDPSDVDTRVELLSVDMSLPRMYFGSEFDTVFYFGYHAMEGTLGGVLAHTMNSGAVQYYKLNGKYIGEIDMDSYIAASHGTTSSLFVGGDIACAQAKRAVPNIITVVTKRELSRNEAVFRNNEELFCDIKAGVREAIANGTKPQVLTFPATFEKSFKRVEDAAQYLKLLLSFGMEATHPCEEILGKDAHTVTTKIYTMDDFIRSI